MRRNTKKKAIQVPRGRMAQFNRDRHSWGIVIALGCLAVAAFFALASSKASQGSQVAASSVAATATSNAQNGAPWGSKYPNGIQPTQQGVKGRATCDEPGQPTCPPADMGWVPVASSSPQDVIAAAMNTDMYQEEAAASGGSIAGLDAPVLVLPYRAHTGTAYYDNAHFITRSHDSAGKDTGTFDFIYDQANHRLAFGSYGGGSASDPSFTKPFPAFVSQAQAVALVRSTRSTDVMAGTTPELIFFPPDPRLSGPQSPLTWNGGGTDPALPMWHIHGANGVDYFVGIDSKVYLDADLPVSPNQAGTPTS